LCFGVDLPASGEPEASGFQLDTSSPEATVRRLGRAMVVWQVTFKREFSIEGHTFNAGATMDFGGTLRRAGDSWLIDNL